MGFSSMKSLKFARVAAAAVGLVATVDIAVSAEDSLSARGLHRVQQETLKADEYDSRYSKTNLRRLDDWCSSVKENLKRLTQKTLSSGVKGNLSDEQRPDVYWLLGQDLAQGLASETYMQEMGAVTAARLHARSELPDPLRGAVPNWSELERCGVPASELPQVADVVMVGGTGGMTGYLLGDARTEGMVLRDAVCAGLKAYNFEFLRTVEVSTAAQGVVENEGKQLRYKTVGGETRKSTSTGKLYFHIFCRKNLVVLVFGGPVAAWSDSSLFDPKAGQLDVLARKKWIKPQGEDATKVEKLLLDPNNKVPCLDRRTHVGATTTQENMLEAMLAIAGFRGLTQPLGRETEVHCLTSVEGQGSRGILALELQRNAEKLLETRTRDWKKGPVVVSTSTGLFTELLDGRLQMYHGPGGCRPAKTGETLVEEQIAQGAKKEATFGLKLHQALSQNALKNSCREAFQHAEEWKGLYLDAPTRDPDALFECYARLSRDLLRRQAKNWYGLDISRFSDVQFAEKVVGSLKDEALQIGVDAFHVGVVLDRALADPIVDVLEAKWRNAVEIPPVGIRQRLFGKPDPRQVFINSKSDVENVRRLGWVHHYDTIEREKKVAAGMPTVRAGTSNSTLGKEKADVTRDRTMKASAAISKELAKISKESRRREERGGKKNTQFETMVVASLTGEEPEIIAPFSQAEREARAQREAERQAELFRERFEDLYLGFNF